jgi:hypothetical protein
MCGAAKIGPFTHPFLVQSGSIFFYVFRPNIGVETVSGTILARTGPQLAHL